MLHAASEPTCIYEISQLQLRDKLVDITENGKATPGRFRLLDCEKLSSAHSLWKRKLSIYEFPEFPPNFASKYATLSYVWRGNPLPKNSASSWGKFNVKGAVDDSDPIGISILAVLCQTVWNMGYRYVWIDRLCIIQDNKDDKALQIRNMYSVYRHCKACLVLPGGIQRIVPLEEETAWITRAWTLQEAVAPENVYVIFDRMGKRKFQWSFTSVMEVFEGAPGMYGMVPLVDILANAIPLKSGSGDRPAIIRDTSGDLMQSESSRVQMTALWGAMQLQGAAKEQAIWRSALMRTSSRHEDMVFSIMGLFGVTLDTKSPVFKGNRLEASRALAQKTLETGRPPNWFGISFFLPPSKSLSMFPETPQTRFVGQFDQIGYWLSDDNWREVASLMNNFTDAGWWLDEIPSSATMSDPKYLEFTSAASPLAPQDISTSSPKDFRNMSFNPNDLEQSYMIDIVATDGSLWGILPGAPGDQTEYHTFIVYVGRQYPWDTTVGPGDCTVRAVIVEEHAPQTYQIKAWCWLGDVYLEWIRRDWHTLSFRIGGYTGTRCAS